jgi:hypothetical protein
LLTDVVIVAPERYPVRLAIDHKLGVAEHATAGVRVILEVQDVAVGSMNSRSESTQLPAKEFDNRLASSSQAVRVPQGSAVREQPFQGLEVTVIDGYRVAVRQLDKLGTVLQTPDPVRQRARIHLRPR